MWPTTWFRPVSQPLLEKYPYQCFTGCQNMKIIVPTIQLSTQWEEENGPKNGYSFNNMTEKL